MILFLSYLASVLFNRDKRKASSGLPAKAKVSLIAVCQREFCFPHKLKRLTIKCSFLFVFASMSSSLTRKAFWLLAKEFWTSWRSAGRFDCHHLQFFLVIFLLEKTSRTHIKNLFCCHSSLPPLTGIRGGPLVDAASKRCYSSKKVSFECDIHLVFLFLLYELFLFYLTFQ